MIPDVEVRTYAGRILCLRLKGVFKAIMYFRKQKKSLIKNFMILNESTTGEVSIIEIDGRLDTTNYGQLEKVVLDYIAKGNIKILVDCSKMDYVSSSGLRIFLMALKKIMGLNGKFVLCGLQESIREIFDISGFTSIFKIFETQEDALAGM